MEDKILGRNVELNNSLVFILFAFFEVVNSISYLGLHLMIFIFFPSISRFYFFLPDLICKFFLKHRLHSGR